MFKKLLLGLFVVSSLAFGKATWKDTSFNEPVKTKMLYGKNIDSEFDSWVKDKDIIIHSIEFSVHGGWKYMLVIYSDNE
ncbi:MAG: hypothetical protein ACRC1T_09875 [Clostridium chrysemydis]|uniref:hypothetical protein n=1 Tax=Clostridium chrysemydis TaxID=2665504 RepID=UPI003F2D5D83